MKFVVRKTQRDRHVIESLVRRHGPISRAAIHDMTQLRRSTISALVRELLEEERLFEDGFADNPMGRKQVLLRVNEKFGYIVAVEFDDEAVVAAVLDLHPRIHSVVRETPDLNHGAAGLTEQLKACARKAMAESGIATERFLGIGLADPGLVDTRRGITQFSSTIDFWRQVPLRDIFQDEFGLPVLVESKTRAKSLAERVLGAGRMAEDMIYVDYGTGIGSAILVDGRLLYGRDCAAGEFGHIPLDSNGPPCKCGSIGCLEAIAGAGAIAQRIRRACREGAGSLALALAGNDVDRIDVWTVLNAARQGDKICGTIVAELGRYLGLGMASLVNLFNPSVIVLDKRLEAASDDLIDQISRVVHRQALMHSSEELAIRFGELDEHAGVIGIALAVIEQYFEIPAVGPPLSRTELVPA